jgi:hypothetical protein
MSEKAKPLFEIWNFYDAPEELRNLSSNGGDEDYIIIVRDPDFDGGEARDDEGDRYTRGFGYFPFEDGFLSRWFSERIEHNGEVIWIMSHS